MPRKLNDWLTSYLEYTNNSEAPEIFHYWTGVSTIAGALRRKVWIDQQFFRWYPNFYILLISPPGIVNKSTTMNIGMKCLKDIAEEKSIFFGPNILTWQALIPAFTEATVAFEIPEEKEPMTAACLTFAASELGNLLDPQNREMIDLLTHLWDGEEGDFKKKTKGSGNEGFTNPWINLIAGVTPAWIAQNFPAHMLETGFSSRTIYVVADKKRHLIAYPADEIKSQSGFTALRDDLRHDLIEVANLAGQFEITPDAMTWGRVWYEKHYNELESGVMVNLGGYAGRKQTHMHKLAMIISTSERDDLKILDSDLNKADQILKLIEPNISSIFSLVADEEIVKKMGIIIRAVEDRPEGCHKEFLYRFVASSMGYNTYAEALESCIKSGKVKVSDSGIMTVGDNKL